MRLIALLLLLTSCFPCQQPLDTCLHHVPTRREVSQLPAPFTPLTSDEDLQDWALEYQVGVHFARDLDLYRAITSFKRALYLLPQRDSLRRQEILYSIALCYYLGDRYEEAIRAVEETELTQVSSDFPAFEDLLTWLYDAYQKTGQCQKADQLYAMLDPERAQLVDLSRALRVADFETLSCEPAPVIHHMVENFEMHKKSALGAQVASAIVPGAGFWYVGQKQSAITAFLLNSLFIAATYQFFARGYWAAGIFTTSLELGWYVGGIYGAGEAAYDYNSRLWEGVADPILEHGDLYPTLMLRWGF